MNQPKVARVFATWRTFSLAVRERPIRLLSLVVLLLSVLLLHGVGAFLVVLALRGPEGWTVFVSPFLEIAGWGFVLGLLALRLWGLRVGALAIRFARSFGRTAKECPGKLLAGLLLVLGIPWTVFCGFLFLALVFSGFDSEFWGPAFAFTLPGIAAVVVGFYLWGEGRRTWAFFLVWFIAAWTILAAASSIWRSLTPPWSDPWLVHSRRLRLLEQRRQRQDTAPKENVESDMPGQSLEQLLDKAQ